MALSGYLSPGTASIYGFASSLSGTIPPNGYKWGYIYGVFTQTGYSVGNTVLYKKDGIITTLVYAEVPYDIVLESKIIFTDKVPS